MKFRINHLTRAVSHIFMLLFTLLLWVACEKEKMPFKDLDYSYETDSVTDVDGNVYKTVKIGDQWWMAENLRVIHYRDLSSIFYDQSMTDKDWADLTKGAYCYLYNGSTPYNGLLYNWYAISNSNGIAPEGWHIPTDDDWKELERFLGMTVDTSNLIGWRGTHEGEKLKSPKTETQLWIIDQNIHNTNESGFTAFPGGCRLLNGIYVDAGPNSTAFWWTSSEAGSDQAWYRYLDYQYAGVFRYYASKASGFSIRCVKDE
jgi:uncharacterized protein (TIGR02145 family)